MAHYVGTVQGAVTFNGDTSAQFRLLWIIPDYLKVKDKVKSPDFIEIKDPVSIIPGKFVCGLNVHPNGEEPLTRVGPIAFYVTNEIDTVDVHMYVTISVLKSDFTEQYVQSEFSIIEENSCWGWDEWFPDTAIEELLSNGSLQILVVGTVFTNKQEQQTIDLAGSVLKKDSILFDVSFLNEPDGHSDTVISVDEEQFQVHKNILSKQSPVFEELFKNQSQNIIVIQHMSSIVFRHILQFIYTGSITAEVDTMLPDILEAADKYKLHYLKSICQNRMIGNISVINALGYFRQGHDQSAFELKEAALEYITKNRCGILKQKSWEEFIARGGDLLAELLQRVMRQY